MDPESFYWYNKWFIILKNSLDFKSIMNFKLPFFIPNYLIFPFGVSYAIYWQIALVFQKGAIHMLCRVCADPVYSYGCWLLFFVNYSCTITIIHIFSSYHAGLYYWSHYSAIVPYENKNKLLLLEIKISNQRLLDIFTLSALLLIRRR